MDDSPEQALENAPAAGCKIRSARFPILHDKKDIPLNPAQRLVFLHSQLRRISQSRQARFLRGAKLSRRKIEGLRSKLRSLERLLRFLSSRYRIRYEEKSLKVSIISYRNEDKGC